MAEALAASVAAAAGRTFGEPIARMKGVELDTDKRMSQVMAEVLDLPDEVLQDPRWERSGHTVRGRDGCRVPIPWTSTGPSLGFSKGTGWLPQPEDWAKLSAAEQQDQPNRAQTQGVRTPTRPLHNA